MPARPSARDRSRTDPWGLGQQRACDGWECDMQLIIPDEILSQAGVTERQMAVEIACRLFDVGFLDLWPAAQVARLSRGEMEEELAKRQIPIYRYTETEYQKDREALKKLWG